jgi:hypothetical protein
VVADADMTPRSCPKMAVTLEPSWSDFSEAWISDINQIANREHFIRGLSANDVIRPERLGH